MVMVSQKRLDSYYSQSKELRTLFWLNLDIAQSEVVVKNSPVDFNTYKLICDIYVGIISVNSVISHFKLMSKLKDRSTDDCKKDNEIIEKFNKLEEIFDKQTQALEILRFKPNALAGD